MASTSVCRNCSQPIEWGDTDNGRRPFNADGSPHFDGKRKSATNGSTPSPDRERAIARMSALRSAAIFAGHRATVDEHVKTEHIFVLAERMLAWLEQP